MYYLQCTAVTMKQDQSIHWCCLVTEPEIHYRKPGNMILYYRKNTRVARQIHRTDGNGHVCAPGWTGPECDVCEGFGISTESGCTECIQIGKWTGTWGAFFQVMTVFLTFQGPECTNLVPGKCLLY